MVTDEERAAIMAEYMNQVNQDNDDDDEEEEFQGDYFDDDDDLDDGSDAYDDEDDDDEDGEFDDKKEEKDDNYAILQGNLSYNDEGKLLYSGTWSMKNQVVDTAAADDDKTSTTKDKKKKKKTKFKLKSKRVLKADSSTTSSNEFNLSNPLLADGKPRSILFDGFFTTDETDAIEPYRKIKERDVELTFSFYGGDVSNGKDGATKKFLVKGKGCNDFGTFAIDGVFDPSMKSTSNGDNENEEGGSTESYPLTCSKKYGSVEPDTKGVKKRRRGYDSEEDYDFEDDGDEGADYNELIGLHEEADMSVEELRKRYYGRGTDRNEKESSSKKIKKTLPGRDDEDDDGCGF